MQLQLVGAACGLHVEVISAVEAEQHCSDVSGSKTDIVISEVISAVEAEQHCSRTMKATATAPSAA